MSAVTTEDAGPDVGGGTEDITPDARHHVVKLGLNLFYSVKYVLQDALTQNLEKPTHN